MEHVPAPSSSPDDDALGRLVGEAYRALARSLPRFRERRSQKALMWHAARALRDGRPLVVEAPTGVGKTYGYLLPALVLARETGRRVVVATATTALQAQLLEDHRTLARALGTDPEAARVLKGRRRYLCEIAAGEALRLGQGALDLGIGDPAGAEGLTGEEAEALAHALADFRARRWTGDFDCAPTRLEPSVTVRASASSSQCAKGACPHVRRCPAVAARRAAYGATVLIVNHDLLLAELERGGGALGDLAEAYLVIDEAHHLPAVAVAHAARALEIGGAPPERPERLAALADALADRADLAALAGESARRLSALAPSWHALAETVRAGLAQEEGLHRYPTGQVPDDVARAASALASELALAVRPLETLAERLADAGLDPARTARLVQHAGVAREKLAQAAETLRRVGDVLDHEDPWTVWVVPHGARGLRVHVSPLQASAALRRGLWSRASSVVLTSATLAVGGSCEDFTRTAGLPPGSESLVLPSPFASGRAVLHVPHGPSPRDVARHTAWIAEVVRQEILGRRGGSLVLFASRRQMLGVYDTLTPAEKRRVLLQGGKLTREVILAKHRERIGKRGRSVIFGLQTFGEGVDLPGELLETLVVAKVPFSPPDDPVGQAVGEWLAAHGRNPFVDVVVPQAAIRLKQWCGRLLRTETDRGEIYILDPRLRGTSYGTRILKSLPAYGRAGP